MIIGARNRTAVVTLTERVTRHTLLAALPNGYRAPHTAQAICDAFSRVPKPLRKTLTWDQGREMSQWCSVEQQTGLSVYFCDPRSPWQRATNEHTNGMLRRWLPKSTNLNIGQIPLSIIEYKGALKAGSVPGLWPRRSNHRCPGRSPQPKGSGSLVRL